MQRRVQLLAPLAVVACLALACHPSESAADARLVRPALRSVEESQPRSSRVVLSIQVPEGSRGWGAAAAVHGTLPSGERTEVHAFEDGGALRFSGPVESAAFNRVEVRGRFRGQHDLELRLVTGEQAIERSGFSFGTPVDDPDNALETVVYDVRDFQSRERIYDELVLWVQGPDCEIHSMDLIDVPLEDMLPGPGAPGLMSIGGHHRRGVGLTDGHPVRSSFSVQPGDRLEFSYGPLRVLDVPTGAPVLRVLLESGTQRVEKQLPVPDGAAERASWLPASLPLDDFAGVDVTATFELEHPGDERTACALTEVFVGSSSRNAPTVLLITSDTHRGDHLGAAAGGVEISTPSIDALARRGLLFEDCYSTSNITAPSHSALMTGHSPRDVGILTNSFARLSESAFTLAEAFGAAGYRTFSLVSVDHLGPEGVDLGQGFDRHTVAGEAGLNTTESVSRLIDWLDEAEGQPVFAWLHLLDPHYPYDPPAPFDTAYYPADRDPYDPSLPESGLEAGQHQPGLEGLRDLEFPKAQYRGEISFLDQELGRLLDHPRVRAGSVAFTSDHGEILVRSESAFDHDLVLHDTLHVPLVIAWPDAPAGTRVSRPVLQTDVGRTLLELAGLGELPFPGTNLTLDLERSKRSDQPRFALGSGGIQASVSTSRWFLVLNCDGNGPRRRHEVELYDLEEDRGCLNNVADERSDVARRLRGLLVAWLEESRDLGLAQESSMSAEQLETLRSLGYTGSSAPAHSGRWMDSDCTCELCAQYE